LRTLGSVWLALLVQVQGDTAPDSSTTIVGLLARSSVVTKIVLLFLALFSIVSWSIILYKKWAFGRASRQTASFIDVFRRSQKFSEVQAICQSVRESPLVGLFQAGYAELTAQLRQNGPADAASAGSNPRPVAGRPTLKSLTAVDRALLRASLVEVNKLERRIPFLATTASIAPFIGLFGTVWGIMDSFQSIAASKNTSLAVVAPGIAESLFATALGLVAAIPAVVAYNKLSSDFGRYAGRLEAFATEFSAILSRQLDERP